MNDYPAALGQRPLEVREAYEALETYATAYGREPLILMMHAAVPETLRADLLNLIKLNFLSGHGADLSMEADVLFSPLTIDLGGGYYRIDPQVRWHCLGLLRSLYRDETRSRQRRVAELLWLYVESMEHKAVRTANPLLSEFLDVQRWVALTFLEPASAAHAFAEALRNASENPATAILRLGGLTSAIELPLANEQELLAYARGVDALITGDDERAQTILGKLGDDEILVGGIALRPPTELLKQYRHTDQTVERDEEKPEKPELNKKTCYVIQGYGQKTDYKTGRTLDLDASYKIIKETVESAGLQCLRADEITHSGTIDVPKYERLLMSDLVITDLSTSNMNALYELGVRFALRPYATIVVAEEQFNSPFDPNQFTIHGYRHSGKIIGQEEANRFREELKQIIEAMLDRPSVDSPVYKFLPLLQPPIWGSRDDVNTLRQKNRQQSAVCFVIQGFGQKTDYKTGRTLDLDASYKIIKKTVESAGLQCLRANEIPYSETIEVPMYEQLLNADLVIADLSAHNPKGVFELGVRYALRPYTTIVVAEEQFKSPFDPIHMAIRRYPNIGEFDLYDAVPSFMEGLKKAIIEIMKNPRIDSPVYTFLPQLLPPVLTPKQPPENAPKVFICYAREDLDQVEPLSRQLETVGIEPWLDKKNHRANHNWNRQLIHTIKDVVDYFIVVQTPAMTSQMEGYCYKEIATALDRQKNFSTGIRFILPIVLSDCEPMVQLRNFHNIRLDVTGGFEQLVDAIKADWQQRHKQGAWPHLMEDSANTNHIVKWSNLIKVFVSYAWEAEKETEIVNELDKLCQRRGFKLIRDNNTLTHGDLITNFLDELSKGSHVITVFSKPYFESKWCMYELLRIYQRGGFEQRTHPVIADDCDLQDSDYRLKVVDFWRNKFEVGKDRLKGKDPLTVIPEHQRVELYRDIHQNINKLLNFASGRVTTPLAELQKQDYTQLLDRIKLAGKQDDSLSPVSINIIEGELMDKQGDFDGALTKYKTAFKHSKQYGDLYSQSVALHKMARINALQGDLELAFQQWDKAYTLSRLINDKAGMVSILNSKANHMIRDGNYDDAIHLLNDSLEFSEETNNEAGRACAQNLRGDIYKQQGDTDEALEIFQESLKFWKRSGDLRNQANTLFAIAEIYAQQNHIERSSKIFHEALELFEQSNDIRGQALVLHELGKLKAFMSDFDAALEFLQKSLELYEQIKDVQGQSVTLCQMAYIVKLGDKQHARDLLCKALQLAKQINDIESMEAITKDLKKINIDEPENDIEMARSSRLEEVLAQIKIKAWPKVINELYYYADLYQNNKVALLAQAFWLALHVETPFKRYLALAYEFVNATHFDPNISPLVLAYTNYQLNLTTDPPPRKEAVMESMAWIASEYGITPEQFVIWLNEEQLSNPENIASRLIQMLEDLVPSSEWLFSRDDVVNT